MPRTKRPTNDSPADCAAGMVECRWRLTDRLIANRHMQGVHMPVPDKTHDAPQKAPHRFLGLVQRAEFRGCQSIGPVVCKPQVSRRSPAAPVPSAGISSPSLRGLLQPFAEGHGIPRATVPHVPADTSRELFRANAALRGRSTDAAAAIAHCIEGMRLRCAHQPHHPLRQQHAGTQRWAVRRRQMQKSRRPGDPELAAGQTMPRPFLTILAVGTQTGSWIGPRHAHCALHKHAHNQVIATEAAIGDLPSRGNAQRLCVERFEFQRLHESTVPRSPKAIPPNKCRSAINFR
jgi:hypothetical protein